MRVISVWITRRTETTMKPLVSLIQRFKGLSKEGSGFVLNFGLRTIHSKLTVQAHFLKFPFPEKRVSTFKTGCPCAGGAMSGG